MANSFATFASQILKRPSNNEESGPNMAASTQPMFFSFTTDGSGRKYRENHERVIDEDEELNDLDDPHLRRSSASRRSHGPELDDPYLHDLDEDGGGYDSQHQQSIPLIASEYSERAEGWLAHQGRESPSSSSSSVPLRHTTRARSPSVASDSTDSGPPQDLLRPPSRLQPPRPPATSRAPVSLSLTESLLPRDGRSRPLDVFSLPDPRHVPKGRRKHNDAMWTATWLAGVSFCIVYCIVLLFTTNPGKTAPLGRLLYTTLLHTIPLLTILTFTSAAVAYAHIFLLSMFVKPVMIATSVFIPATLLISSLWAFIGSFMWEAGTEPTWGETVGLRLFALVPLALAVITGRRLLHLPRDIHTTSATLNLAIKLLIANPLLLALSPCILLAGSLASIPFLTLIFRLLLIGTETKTSQGTWEWHVQNWASWVMALTIGIWLWTWGVARGILRMTCASVIGYWYFSDPHMLPPPPMSTHTIHAAITRSSGPSLGTIVLSALILTGIRVLTLLTLFLERLPIYLPVQLIFMVSWIRMAVGFLDSVTTALSKYALVYVGLTGDPFMPSARRTRALTSKAGRGGLSAEPPLMLLTVAPLTLTFPFALTTYLFVAHTLGAPNQALGAAILAGGVTALVGLFCIGLVRDTADALFICYCIDKDVGERRREEVFQALEYESRPTDTGPTLPTYREQPRTPTVQPPVRLPLQASRTRSPVRAPAAKAASPLLQPPEDLDPFANSPLVESQQIPMTHSRRIDSDSDDEGSDQLFPGSGLY